MGEPRKFILDRFQEHLKASFETFCLRHNLEKNEQHLVTFLIDQDLIAPVQLQRFTVLKEFERISHEPGCPKTYVVDTLANRFCISERTVWNILKTTKPQKK